MNIASIRRDLLWGLLALMVGLLLLPPLIGMVGARVVGPYAAGTTRDLVSHFYRGLGQGQAAVWIVALGPCVALAVFRLTLAAMRAVRSPA